MGYRDYSVKRRMPLWSENNALLMLIILNVFVYITLRFILAVYGLSGGVENNYYKQIFEWFSMPADFSTFITRPWTILSSGFTHMDFWMLLSNMFWLWTYGYIFQDLTGNRRIFPLYLYSAVIGAGIYLLCYAIFPQLKSAPETQFYFGAIAPIMAIAVGATAFAPGYRLFPMIAGGIPLWVMTVVFLIIDVFYLTARPAWFFPHIGAALTGFPERSAKLVAIKATDDPLEAKVKWLAKLRVARSRGRTSQYSSSSASSSRKLTQKPGTSSTLAAIRVCSPSRAASSRCSRRTKRPSGKASTACASMYSLTGLGSHDIFRDLIVLKSSSPDEKGVVLLKYARTFDAVIALFDLPRLLDRYVFVLEPCWAGYCDPSILMFISSEREVIVQCPESLVAPFIAPTVFNKPFEGISVGIKVYAHQRHGVARGPEVEARAVGLC